VACIRRQSKNGSQEETNLRKEKVLVEELNLRVRVKVILLIKVTVKVILCDSFFFLNSL